MRPPKPPTLTPPSILESQRAASHERALQRADAELRALAQIGVAGYYGSLTLVLVLQDGFVEAVRATREQMHRLPRGAAA